MVRPYRPRSGFDPKFMEDRCAAAVCGGRIGPRQCRHKATVRESFEGVEYGWCKMHAPSAVEKRKAAQKRRWEEKWAAEKASWERKERLRKANEAARKALEEIAAGHNDPRALARQVIAMYPEGGR